MRKLLCLLLVLVMLPVSAAFADQPVSWLYEVTPGAALSGDGLQPVLIAIAAKESCEKGGVPVKVMK